VLLLAIAGAWAFREVRKAPGPVVPVAAEEFGDAPLQTGLATPAVIPGKSVLVPLLLLSNGSDLRVGESETAVSEKLERAWKTGTDALERVAGGMRVTRAYDDGGKRFLLVFEPEDGAAERRLSGIYVK
jgi:hypothetical protein